MLVKRVIINVLEAAGGDPAEQRNKGTARRVNE